jgi:hypothetical protein
MLWQLHSQYRIIGLMKRVHNNLTKNCHANSVTARRSLDACMSSKSVEWNTPSHIVESVLKILGTVDLDPCSNSKSNPNIPAKQLYTKAENGLKEIWKGRVYLNPPYGREIRKWVKKLHDEYQAHNTKEAIALLPARTDTKWFRILRPYPRCFIHGRLKFGDATNSAPFPSVVVYLGRQQEKFQSVFSEFGDIYVIMN